MADGLAFAIDDTAVVATFDAMPGKVRAALVAKCSALSLQLEAKIKGKVSGEVLNVVSGNLRRSIFSEVYADEAGVHAYAASSGDVPYAGIHEFGFTGVEHVSAHKRMITQAFGKPLKDAILAEVRPFDRQMHMPERSFLRSSLAEMAPEIVIGLQDAVSGALAP